MPVSSGGPAVLAERNSAAPALSVVAAIPRTAALTGRAAPTNAVKACKRVVPAARTAATTPAARPGIPSAATRVMGHWDAHSLTPASASPREWEETLAWTAIDLTP